MSKNIVFIINIKEADRVSRSESYHFSIDSWKAWCKKNECELFILEDRIYPKDYMNIIWHKIFVFDLLENEGIDYNKIMIVDADTIIHPDAPNIFEKAGDDFAVVRNYGSMDWVCRSYENYKTHMFQDITFSPFDYFNAGMVIINKSHKEFYTKLQQFYFDNVQNLLTMQKTYGVGTDQPILNFMTRKENIKLEILPYEWNMQDMQRFEILDDNFTFTKIGWLYHFCAVEGGPPIVNQWMGKTYRHLYEN